MERREILEMMGELKLSGMRAAYDEIVTQGVKRSLGVERIIGALLKAEIAAGLPRIAIPVSKLEPGTHAPAFELAGAQRRPAQMLAARPFLGPVDDIRVMSVAGWRCNGVASARSGPGLHGAS